jgi:hypothetical protein
MAKAKEVTDESGEVAKGTQYTTVTMDDGRVVDFAGKRKMIKDSVIHEDGSVSVRTDFVNGESRTFTIPAGMLLKFAAHGAEQKLGDEIAGVTDVEDCVLAIDELTERLNNGEWGVVRAAGNSIAGTSVLARALCEHSGKQMDAVKNFLKDKTQAQKMALRNNPSISVIVARLEAEKVKKAKGPAIDTEAMLGEL